MVLGEWAFRTKMNGLYRQAPMMVDKMQATGSSATSITSWYSSSGGKTVADANHTTQRAFRWRNFLYEDGRVNGGGLIWRITRRPSTSARRRAGGWFLQAR